MTKIWLVLFMFVNGHEQIVEREPADEFKTLAGCRVYAKELAKEVQVFNMGGVPLPYGRIECIQDGSK